MQQAKFKYYLFSREVFPLGTAGCKLGAVREKNQMFFRTKFSGSLEFGNDPSQDRDDFDYLKAIFEGENETYNRFDKLELRIDKLIGGEYQPYWTGYFRLVDCDFDYEIIKASPKVVDKYSVFLEKEDTEVNYKDLPDNRRFISKAYSILDFKLFKSEGTEEGWELASGDLYGRERILTDIFKGDLNDLANWKYVGSGYSGWGAKPWSENHPNLYAVELQVFLSVGDEGYPGYPPYPLFHLLVFGHRPVFEKAAYWFSSAPCFPDGRYWSEERRYPLSTYAAHPGPSSATMAFSAGPYLRPFA